MAGIYLHIPFCRQACHYCDFHFSTNVEIIGDLVRAIGEEISLQENYLEGEAVNTIYFGGGTPSMLQADHVKFLLERICQVHQVSPDAEITLEANPDDLTPAHLTALRSLGINRLSIGIQSFDNNILQYLNRSHSAIAAVDSVKSARQAGFNNISIDLIYAIPGLSNAAWQDNIQRALSLKPDHISAYTLTIEEKTAFGNWLSKGKLLPVDERAAAEQVDMLVALLAAHGYVQYEISNFARPGYESRHNRSYWDGDKYLGVGPSAHSYNQKVRQHNVANNHMYVRAVMEGKIPAEAEVLTREDRINEYILTTLRTSSGCDVEFLKQNFGYDVFDLHRDYIVELQRQEFVLFEDQRLRLTKSGRLLADKISSDLFLIQ